MSQTEPPGRQRRSTGGRSPPSPFQPPSARLRGWTLASGAILFVLLTADVHFHGALATLGSEIGAWVQGRISPEVQHAWHAYGSAPGHDEVAWPLLFIAGGVMAWQGRWRTGVFAVASGLLSGLAVWTLKGFFAVARPDVVLAGAEVAGRSASFPSGHTAKAVVVYGLILYFALYTWVSRTRRDPRTLMVPFVLLWAAIALVVGLARVLSGHHWPTDVVASWTLGLAWLSASVTVHERWVRPFEQLAAGRQPTNEAVL